MAAIFFPNTVSNVATGAGLAGGPITTTGTISLATIADKSVLANTSGGTAAPSATTLTAASAAAGVIIPLVDGPTIPANLALGNWFSVSLGGSRTLMVSNPTVGQEVHFVLIQGGVGSNTATWFSGINWAGGFPPTLTTAVGQGDIITVKCVSAGVYYGWVTALNITIAPPTPPPVVWTHIQDAGVTGGSGLSVTFGNPVAAGNLVIGIVAGTNFSSAYNDNLGNFYNVPIQASGVGGTLNSSLFYSVVQNSGVCTFTPTGSTNTSISISEFSPGGGTLSSGAGVSAVNSDPAAFVAGNITLPATPGLVIMGGAVAGVPSMAADVANGFTLGYTVGASSSRGVVLQYNINENSSPINPQVVYTGSAVWAAVGIAFKTI